MARLNISLNEDDINHLENGGTIEIKQYDTPKITIKSERALDLTKFLCDDQENTKLSSMIHSHAKEMTKNLDILVGEKYFDEFHVSPFLIGTNILTNSATKRLEGYEIKLINEKYEAKGNMLVHSIDDIQLVKIKEADNDNINQE
ncbi:hypothetical protein P7H41_05445 [Vagococcus fluvialis]|uniref:hypothetical protein n=1 Tax=Vagococcus fluvialis TaxID=2738 RepID=UPI00288F93C1|nr:hypothetical protein [Vagococcus fluvialis]MDT2781403.1 hypothetical protein [Vagococcus fluvialis]